MELLEMKHTKSRIKYILDSIYNRLYYKRMENTGKNKYMDNYKKTFPHFYIYLKGK